MPPKEICFEREFLMASEYNRERNLMGLENNREKFNGFREKFNGFRVKINGSSKQ